MFNRGARTALEQSFQAEVVGQAKEFANVGNQVAQNEGEAKHITVGTDRKGTYLKPVNAARPAVLVGTITMATK